MIRVLPRSIVPLNGLVLPNLRFDPMVPFFCGFCAGVGITVGIGLIRPTIGLLTTPCGGGVVFLSRNSGMGMLNDDDPVYKVWSIFGGRKCILKSSSKGEKYWIGGPTWMFGSSISKRDEYDISISCLRFNVYPMAEGRP